MGDIYYNLIKWLIQREADFDRLLTSLNENVDMISRCLTFTQRKNLIEKQIIGYFIDRFGSKLQNDRGHHREILKFEELLCDGELSQNREIKNFRRQRVKYLKSML